MSAMPRKRWLTQVSTYDAPHVDPSDPSAVADDDLVRHALVDFDELAVLSDVRHGFSSTDFSVRCRARIGSGRPACETMAQAI